MLKRLLGIICAMAMIFSCMPAELAVNATTDRYMVGYAIRDINPWVDYNDHSKGIQKGLFNLTGNQNDDTRPLEGLFDDNGDGVKGDGDGIFTTATAITDPYGNTVIFITIDSLMGYGNLTRDVRQALVEQLGKYGITADRIMVNGSHSHSSAPFSSLKGKADGKGEYYTHVVNQMTEAAIAAYSDRAYANMSKGTVDAKDATAELGYNGGKGYHMNANRHYEVTMTHKSFSSVKKTYMCWTGDTLDKQSEYPFATSGTNKKKVRTVEESDNDMHLLLFEFPDNADKQPIVMVNWRAHTTMNSGVSSKLLSSDYVNGLRTTLAKMGYRAAFFQGAAGNVVTAAKSAVWSAYPEYKDWLNESPSESKKTFIYGRMLAEIAQYCIKESGAMKAIAPEKIRTLQSTWHGELQPYTEGHLAAAMLTKEMEANGEIIEYPFRYEYEGERYILNSNYHRNAVISRSNASSTYTNLELNAILLGDDVAFVTAPNELADKFHIYNEGEKYSNELNDWKNLIDDSYGVPFVLGYCNDSYGYIASWLDHAMNSQIYTDITGFAENGEEFFDPGTYESNTSRFAQGQGEELIKYFGKMLKVVQSGNRTAYCEACKETVEWAPILATSGSLPQATGHYYLYEDMLMGALGNNRCSVKGDTKICLDLNGHKMETRSRTFYIDESATVNLFDSVGTGQAISYSGGNNVGGGAMYGSAKSTLNIYGGTLQFIKQTLPDGKYETGNGGVISTSGTVNVYGGKLIGGEMSMSTYYASGNTSNGNGGTVFLSGSAKLNVFGGQILAGKAAEDRYGDCVYVTGKKATVTLSGDAVVDEIYLSDRTNNQIVFEGTYTGRTAVNVNVAPTSGMQLGTLKSADITKANLTFSGGCKYALTVSEDKLVTAARQGDDAAVVLKDYTAVTYQNIDEAIRTADGGMVILLREVAEDITIEQNTYVDLNGFNITGKVKVNDGCVLYCLDSETDDFSVSDGRYGRLSLFEGTVLGVPESDKAVKDGYLMITEPDGTSFHRVDLQLTAMSLQPENAGLYYKSGFSGDEVVARYVDRFGVALSLKEEPNANNLKTYCAYSWFDNFKAGSNSANSTVLKDIMRTSHTDDLNSEYAQMPIYGRAYIKLKDGSYLFGASATRSFRQQLEAANDTLSSYSTAQRKAAATMCQTYFNVVRTWDIDAILAYGASNDGITKIFAIGDDFTVDSMHLLHEVYKAEKPTQKVILGYACHAGSTLAQHVEFMSSGDAVYTYYEVEVDGTRTISHNKTLEELVMDENWDIVVLQQGSSDAGLEVTYNTDIKKLQDYVTDCHGYSPKFAWNMTWSYPEKTDSNADGWVNYGSQEAMFNGIVTAVKNKIVSDTSFNYLIPSGLVIQNARTYYAAASDLHRDAHGHLNDFSRLMAAYMWYCELQGITLKSVMLTSISAGLTEPQAESDIVITDVQKQVVLQCVNGARTTKKDKSFSVTQFVLPQ